jgi:two-component system sensor histidine kinase YesM
MSSIGTQGYLTHLTENITQKKEGTFNTEMKVEYQGHTSTQSVVATYQEIPTTGWKVMGIIPTEQLDRWGNILLILMTALTVMIVLMAIYMAIRTSNRFAKPIQNLRLAMSHVEEGDLDITIDLDSHYEEINQLARSFNIMVSKVKGLLTDIYEDQRKLRKAELKALQSQINPHFLYNTFDSILWLNRSDRKEDVEIMVESLTDFFRLSLSRGKEIIPLEEEVKHLESYLMIQHIRYGDKFDYSIDVDKEALNKMVPKLILQPLVENAIYHGIKLKKENCKISITIRSEKETVITIKDTGIGMPEEKVDQLNRAMKGEMVSGLELYGIRNIRDRLAIFFGETANISYKSIEGEGTTVMIVFPIISLDTDI